MRVDAAFGFRMRAFGASGICKCTRSVFGISGYAARRTWGCWERTLTHSELLLDEKNALRFLKCAFAHLKFPSAGK